jgi:hypothetical protein
MTQYVWIGMLGFESIITDMAVEGDERILVDAPTLERMASDYVEAGVIGEDEDREMADTIRTTPQGDGGLYDVTEYFGSWRSAQDVRVEA